MNGIRDRIPQKTRVRITQDTLARALKLFLIYPAIITCALTQGFTQPNTVLLLVGSAFSLFSCGLYAYNIMFLSERTRLQMIKMALIGGLVAVAFLFDMYVTFYCGAWHLISLFWAFSFPALIRGVVLTVAGASATIATSDLIQIERFAAHQIDAAMDEHQTKAARSNLELRPSNQNSETETPKSR